LLRLRLKHVVFAAGKRFDRLRLTLIVGQDEQNVWPHRRANVARDEQDKHDDDV